MGILNFPSILRPTQNHNRDIGEAALNAEAVQLSADPQSQWRNARISIATSLSSAFERGIHVPLCRYARKKIFGENKFDKRALLEAGFHEEEFESYSGRQRYFLKFPKDVAKRILFVIPGRNETASTYNFLECPAPSTAVALLSYPGRGGCEGGLPTPTCIERALLDALDVIPQRYSQLNPKITLFARSLGTGFTLRLAARHSGYLNEHAVDQLVLVSPYEDFITQAYRSTEGKQTKMVLRALGKFKELGFDLDNLDCLKTIRSLNTAFQILIFHGTADADIPWDCARELRNTCPDLVRFFGIGEAAHGDILQNPMHREKLFAFWRKWSRNRKVEI